MPPKTIKIEPGSNLSTIAAQNKTTVDELLKANQGNPSVKSKDLIIAGGTLNLPGVVPSPVTQQFVASSGVVTSDPLRNAEQKATADQAKQMQEEQKELERLRVQKEMADLKTSIAGGITTPAAPDLEGTYTKLLNEKDPSGYSVQDYQTSITALNSQKEEALAQLRKFREKIPEGVSQGFAQGTISQEERDVQDKVDFINRQINTYALQLQNRNSVIETMMSLRKEDYSIAADIYDKEFSKNLSVFNAIAAREDKAASIEERAQDNARANLQILANQLASGDLKLEDDPLLKTQINNLELQAGLPTGTIAAIKDRNPKADILSTTTRTDAAGNKYLDVVTRDTVTGALKVETQLLGRERIPDSGSGGTTLRSAKAAGVAKARPTLEAVTRTSGDGYTDPRLYQTLRLDFIQAFGSPDVYDDAFSNLLSPQERARLGVGKATGVKATDTDEDIF